MKFILPIFICILILVITNQPAFSQDSSSKMKTWIINNKEFPGGLTAWENYLKKSIDTMVPIRNKAKKGIYTVLIRFIIAKDGTVSDVTAETKHGYGMEDEVIKAVKKSVRWQPAEQNAKKDYVYARQSFTFYVPKRKGFLYRLFHKHS